MRQQVLSASLTYMNLIYQWNFGQSSPRCLVVPELQFLFPQTCEVTKSIFCILGCLAASLPSLVESWYMSRESHWIENLAYLNKVFLLSRIWPFKTGYFSSSLMLSNLLIKISLWYFLFLAENKKSQQNWKWKFQDWIFFILFF